MNAENPPIVGLAQEAREVLRALEADPEDAAATRSFMEKSAHLLQLLWPHGVVVEPAVRPDEEFRKVWRRLPTELLNHNWHGLGEIFLRRMIVEFRATQDRELRRVLGALLASAGEESPQGVAETLAAKPMPGGVARRLKAADAEINIILYQARPDPAQRAAIMETIADTAIRKHVSQRRLWTFLAIDHCRKMDEAVLAGNRADQLQHIRALTRFLATMIKVNPPDAPKLTRHIHNALARAILRADRPVAVGIVEYLRQNRQVRSTHILRALADEGERLYYVNFYYWATGKSRTTDWYVRKFQRYFSRPLRFISEEKGFAFQA